MYVMLIYGDYGESSVNVRVAWEFAGLLSYRAAR